MQFPVCYAGHNNKAWHIFTRVEIYCSLALLENEAILGKGEMPSMWENISQRSIELTVDRW